MSAISAQSEGLSVLRETDTAAALLSGDRLKLVRELDEPDSAAGVARRLGLPRQKVNYHLRELEKRGLVEQVGERQARGCTERLLRATARGYVISPDALGELGGSPEMVRDRFSSAYLVALAARMLRELGVLRERADASSKKLPTISIESEINFASQQDQSEFAQELSEQVARLIAKYDTKPSKKTRLFRFILGGYPAVTKTADEAAQERPRNEEHTDGE